jgi:hypothetical protein
MRAFETGYSSSNKSSFSSADDKRQNYQSKTSTTSAPKTKTYTNVNPTNDKVTTSTIKQSTLNNIKKNPKKKLLLHLMVVVMITIILLLK